MSLNVEVVFPNAGGVKETYQVPDGATAATLTTIISTNQTPLHGAGAAIQIRMGPGPGRVLAAGDPLYDGTLYNAR